jgi:hypothetical protein
MEEGRDKTSGVTLIGEVTQLAKPSATANPTMISLRMRP